MSSFLCKKIEETKLNPLINLHYTSKKLAQDLLFFISDLSPGIQRYLDVVLRNRGYKIPLSAGIYFNGRSIEDGGISSTLCGVATDEWLKTQCFEP
jgi:hypothetical protein